MPFRLTVILSVLVALCASFVFAAQAEAANLTVGMYRTILWKPGRYDWDSFFTVYNDCRRPNITGEDPYWFYVFHTTGPDERSTPRYDSTFEIINVYSDQRGVAQWYRIHVPSKPFPPQPGSHAIFYSLLLDGCVEAKDLEPWAERL